MQRTLVQRTLALLLLLAACKAEPGDDTRGESSGGTTAAPTTADPTTSSPTTSSPTTGGTTEAPTTVGPTTGGTTEAPTTANPTTAGTTTGDDPACVNYCETIAMNCNGANAQYAAAESCLGVCATFAPGMDGDVAGNSLACRLYHLTVAATDAATPTVHAGPAGAGACGTNCESFCSIATEICPAEHPDIDTCLATCMAFMDTEKYDASDAAGDTLACRLYHLTVAATDAASATTHCPHTVADSPPCK